MSHSLPKVSSQDSCTPQASLRALSHVLIFVHSDRVGGLLGVLFSLGMVVVVVVWLSILPSLDMAFLRLSLVILSLEL